MAGAFLDRWSDLGSPIHRAPAGLKLAIALAVVIAAVGPSGACRWVLPGLAVALAVVLFVSRVPPLFVLKRLLLLAPMMGGIVLLSAFRPGGAGAATAIVVKSVLSLTAMILLTSTTRFTDMIGVLRRARVPALLVTVLTLMYRYAFVIADEGSRMQRARTSRTFSARRGHVWRSNADLVGQLFVRSTERAERIYAAMCARGWQ